MNSLFKNNKIKYKKHIMIEKNNHEVSEMTVFEILETEYGFEPKVIIKPLSKSLQILKSLGVPVKKEIVYSFDVYISEINGNKFEIIFDIWSTVLLKNGTTIFDDAIYGDRLEEFFKLLT